MTTEGIPARLLGIFDGLNGTYASKLSDTPIN